MGKYLDLAGLEHVMQSIQQKLRRKQDALSPDASITLKDNTIGVTTPVRGVTQKEYDALPEEEKAKGMYVIADSAPTISNGTSEEVYSTEEVRIGTWIDGKPLYRRTFQFTTPNSGQYAAITEDLPNIIPIEWNGSFCNNSSRFPLNYVSTGNQITCVYYEKINSLRG